MLRVLVLAAAGLFLTAALVGVAIDPTTFPTLVVAVLLFVGTAFERFRYRALRPRPIEPGWRETPERFVDDASGRAVTVWIDPASGERRYVTDANDR